MRLGLHLVLAVTIAPGAVYAQATANPGALDGLNPARPATKPATKPAIRPAPRPSPAPVAAAPAPAPASTPARPGAAARTSTARQPLPTVPTTPPPIAVLPPPTPVPVRPLPPAIIPLATDAPGGTSDLPSGLRVTFGPERADLNATTIQTLRHYAASLGHDENTTVTLMAYAAAVPDDPSTPRRLSLARALAARAVLMDAGIASTRIYPRALGPTVAPGSEDVPADRVDLIRSPAEPLK